MLPTSIYLGASRPAAKSGYDAPFPDESYKAGARQFPLLVPISPDDPASEPNWRAWAMLETLQTPFLCAFSDLDWASRGNDSHLCGRIAGAEGQPRTTITGGGHVLQEDRGPELAAAVDAFIRSTS